VEEREEKVLGRMIGGKGGEGGGKKRGEEGGRRDVVEGVGSSGRAEGG